MKKVLFFDKLDYIHINISNYFKSLFLVPNWSFEMQTNYLKTLKLHKYLNTIGINWISFYEVRL